MEARICTVQNLSGKSDRTAKETAIFYRERMILAIVLNFGYMWHKFTHTAVIKWVVKVASSIYRFVKKWAIRGYNFAKTRVNNHFDHKLTIREKIKYFAIGLGSVFALWVMASIGNVDANNMGVGTIAVWNFFRVIIPIL